jgi:hypothetical protein
MGNCQPIYLPQRERTCSLDEDDFSVAATPSSLFACQGASSLASTIHRNPVADQGGRCHKSHSKSFLKLHRPDVAQRCIIEPDEVNRILWIQADELLGRRGLVKRVGFDERMGVMQALQSTLSDETTFAKFGEESSKFDLFSDAGATSMVSGFTTASRSTIVAGNARPTRKFNSDKITERNHRGKPIISGRFPNHHGLQSVSEGPGQMTSQMRGEQNGVSATTQTATTKLFEKLLPPPRSVVDSQRSHYMSVLRLKMQARLGDFYARRYLAMFPNGPRPRGMQTLRMGNDMPELVSDSSSHSSESSRSNNSPLIDYGAFPPTTSVKCSVTNEPFLDLAITGSLGLIPRKARGASSHHFSSSLSSRGFLIQGKLKSPDHYIVLINRRSGIPLAVCAMKAGAGPPIVRIYATRQRVHGQRPAATTKQLGLEWAKEFPLFAWFEVVSEGDFPRSLKFTLFMANGSEGRFAAEPSYEATLDKDWNQPVIKMVGRTGMERMSSGCALISIRADPPRGNKREPEISFHMDLAQGIDPALIICFSAIADEVMEKSMRTQCREHAQQRIRQASISLAKKRMESSFHQ